MKKLPIKITAAAMACVISAFTLSACDKECDHAYRWTVLDEPTCTQEGLQQGLCGFCGDLIDEHIPINPDNHSYGEWEIEQPTEQTNGRAVKTCENSEEHVYEVELPTLNDVQSYASANVTMESGVVTDGVRTYVFDTDEGEVIFDVTIPAHGVQSVADAVEASGVGKSFVRRADAEIRTGAGHEGGFEPQSISYEFGENYTHINDAINSREIWAQIDEDGFYGYQRNSSGFIALDSRDRENINGFGFTLSYVLPPSAFYYGAETLLSGMYAWGSVNTNGDFAEEYTQTQDGGYTASFSFGNLAAVSSGGRFSVIEVEFEITEYYALKSLHVEANTYSNDQENPKWATSGGTTALIDENAEPDYRDYVTVTQTLIPELDEEEAADVPQNPYDRTAFDIASFELRDSSNETIGDEGITISANYLYPNSSPARPAVVNIAGVQPSYARMATDPISVYLVTESGEVLLSHNTHNSVGVLAYQSSTDNLNNTSVISIRSLICGDITLRLKTKKFSTDLKVHVTPQAPESLNTAVFESTSGDEFIMNTTSAANSYVGQNIYFTACVQDSSVSRFTDSSYTISVLRNGQPAEERDYTATEVQINGIASTQFVPRRTGTFTITLISVLNPQVSCTLTLGVSAMPTEGNLLTGTHIGTLRYPKQGTAVEIEFNPDGQTGQIRVTLSHDRPNDSHGRPVDGLGTETLLYSYDSATRTLTTMHGAGEELGCSISLNENYRFVFTHPDGFPGGGTESVVLSLKT